MRAGYKRQAVTDIYNYIYKFYTIVYIYTIIQFLYTIIYNCIQFFVYIQIFSLYTIFSNELKIKWKKNEPLKALKENMDEHFSNFEMGKTSITQL